MDQSKIAVLLSYEKNWRYPKGKHWRVIAICVHEVEKSLSIYPFGNVKTELIQGLNHGFKLQYNGPRLPVQSKNSRSVSDGAKLWINEITDRILGWV
jgi:hypothetical protein